MDVSSARRLRRLLAQMVCSLTVAAAGFGGLAAATTAAATFGRGFVDNVWVWPANHNQTPKQWATNVYKAGGRIAEIEVDWAAYEPKKPKRGANADNPSSADYKNWSGLDASVERLVAAHVKPLFLVTEAPGWAQANHGSNHNTEGYEPNDRAFQAFMTALATRYDGRFRTSRHAHTHPLPRVTYYQAWAEANLPTKLLPEWVRTPHGWEDAGAVVYRNLLNAFYAGVKRAQPSDVVIFTGLESYGDDPGKELKRVRPATFLEDVLCLNAKLQKVCNTPAHFDVMASDPYDAFAPNVGAINEADVSAPDLARFRPILNAAIRDRTVYPDTRKPLWVTEFGYDSDPPNHTPGTPSLRQQARWLDLSLYTFWHEGVSQVLWYLIRDQAGQNPDLSYFSGIYFFNGTKKPSYTAYRFPLVVMPDRSRAQIWGISPVRGTVLVQQHLTSGWRTVRSFHVSSGAVFDALIAPPAGGKASYRAVVGQQTSLAWSY
jgi:hypothetical protein